MIALTNLITDETQHESYDILKKLVIEKDRALKQLYESWKKARKSQDDGDLNRYQEYRKELNKNLAIVNRTTSDIEKTLNTVEYSPPHHDVASSTP